MHPTKFTCYADITDQGIQVRAGSAIAPNVQLRGHASELLKRALANDSQAAVEVNGDETLLLELVNILGTFAQTQLLRWLRLSVTTAPRA